jgi:hypothetical protein
MEAGEDRQARGTRQAEGTRGEIPQQRFIGWKRADVGDEDGGGHRIVRDTGYGSEDTG